MARERSAGSDILMIIVALVLFILALSGNASEVLAALLKWLTGGALNIPVSKKSKSKNNDNNNPPSSPTPSPQLAKSSQTAQQNAQSKLQANQTSQYDGTTPIPFLMNGVPAKGSTTTKGTSGGLTPAAQAVGVAGILGGIAAGAWNVFTGIAQDVASVPFVP